ncbi:hypothetical protein [Streptomyces sp. URMC 129]|uniref:hypothetical protein n=1 Tax=Streptomyces sp. URMC 129 TaxID=3423407 RepID=UPI003F1CB6C6
MTPPDGGDARPVLSTETPTAPEPETDLTEPSPDEGLTEAVTPEPSGPAPAEQSPPPGPAPVHEEEEEPPPATPAPRADMPEALCDVGDVTGIGTGFLSDLCEGFLGGGRN